MTEYGVHIKINELEKSFKDFHVLKKINLEIEAGEFIAIVGKSGCGKSTLLRLLAGLDGISAGELLHDGKQLTSLSKEAKFMFQDSRLLPWLTVKDNVGIGLKGEQLQKVEWALDKVGLLDRAGDWPGILSGGQKQRVALARALVSEPRLLLLDEPLGALDALTRIEMQSLIEELWQEKKFTAIMVTHDVSEAVTLANRVILIEQGQISLDQHIELYRPRDRGNPVFANLEGTILNKVLGKTVEREPVYSI